MKFLVISPTPTHPQDAGNRQRIFELLMRLKGFGHELHFCFIRREWVSDDDIETMQNAWDKVTLLSYDRKKEQKSKGNVFGIDDWFTTDLGKDFEELSVTEQPDVVIVEYVFFSKALEYFGNNCVKIIDTHDIFTNRHLILKNVGLEPSFFYTESEEEAKGLNRADIVLAIQDEERSRLQELTCAAVITVGFWPQIPTTSTAVVEPRVPVVGYIGSKNPLNIRSLQRFIEAVDIDAINAGKVKIRIAGGIATEINNLPPTVESVGVVNDLRCFYDGLNLVVNPHEGGTGLKIKTVEALAYGRPVIGTSDAFRGLMSEAAFHSARSAAEAGNFVNRYVQEPNFRNEVESESRRVAESYSSTVERQMQMFRSKEDLHRRLERPRFLFLTDITFWLESLGNHARMTEQLREARHYMDIDVLIFRALSEADLAALQTIVGARGRVFSFTLYPGAETRRASWIEASKTLSGFEKGSFNRQYFESLEDHLRKHEYNGYILQYIRLSYLRYAKGLPKISIIDTHDVMSLRVRNFSHFGVDHFLKIDEREELDILNAFSAILAIQAFEFNYLKKLFPAKTIYFPHALSGVTRPKVAETPKKIVFVGGDSPMNRDGLNWFLSQIWPCFYNRGIKFHVAGDVCNAIMPGLPNVVLNNRVADLKTFLSQADIAINPVYYGGGLKIKTVEYLCYGIPSVLTAEATFGIPDGGGKAFLLAKSRAEFIEHLDLLISSADARQRISEASFAFGRRMFGSRAMMPGLQAIAALGQAYHVNQLTLSTTKTL